MHFQIKCTACLTPVKKWKKLPISSLARIKPMTSGFDQMLLYQLNFKARLRVTMVGRQCECEGYCIHVMNVVGAASTNDLTVNSAMYSSMPKPYKY